MPRRRYRLFTVCAIVIVFMLYRVAQNSSDDPAGYGNLRSPMKPEGVQPPPDEKARVLKYTPPAVEEPEAAPVAGEKPYGSQYEKTSDYKPDDGQYHKSYDADTKASSGTSGDASSDTSSATPGDTSHDLDADLDLGVKIPDLKNHDDGAPSKTVAAPDTTVDDDDDDDDYDDEEDDDGDDDEIIEPKNPGKVDIVDRPKTPLEIHWSKVPEHFPVDEASLILLPTGSPKAIPKIQHDFGLEPQAQKTEREGRQKRVKAEIERAWGGYRKYAWNHDELSPVSGRYRDPFCGWAATLVDSLDTLWIAGLRIEFEDAVTAVGSLDFTWTRRNEIPVFETTIRYLGGLLAAYDVSGGNYPVLLEKAVELGEILMGIFDTPNRMPILYYQWKPEYASQPHRAGRVGIAELGTLSMEFTRLAQLTGKQKYYDGVARITDALVELQEAGTTIPGLFPQYLDASGCNRTATTKAESLSAAAQKQLDSDELLVDPAGYTPGAVADKVVGQAAVDKQKDISSANAPPASDDRLEKRATVASAPAEGASAARAADRPAEPNKRRAPIAANGKESGWDCVPQAPVVAYSSGYQRYHMGGSQDSAYEYFSKQYLLLGGLEPKYKKLHEDTVDAVNEWLLYAAMTDPEWDVLFPAAVSTRGHPDTDLDVVFEVTHLTCFIGGMYGLGGKVFGRPEDVEIAKRLTDGCVWAYQSTRSGLMPESARVVPCTTLEKCEFNETLWWDHLDPTKDLRDDVVAKWEAARLEVEDEDEDEVEDEDEDEGAGSADNLYKSESSIDTEQLKQRAADPAVAGSIQKRAAVPLSGDASDKEEGSELPESLKNKLDPNRATKASSTSASSSASKSKHEIEDFRGNDAPFKVPKHTLPKKYPSLSNEKPKSHKEYVLEKITREGLSPGFVDIINKSYILRPEAIESVWYMYRITGDPTWMDKGWRMFEATVRATRTEIANSAVHNVMMAEPALKDEMESFWIAETLKYYYLLFSEPDVISLDEWVLNTEAHPFKRPE